MRDVTRQRQMAHRLVSDCDVAEVRQIVAGLRERQGHAGALAICIVLQQLAEEGLPQLPPHEARRVRELMPVYGFSPPGLLEGKYHD